MVSAHVCPPPAGETSWPGVGRRAASGSARRHRPSVAERVVGPPRDSESVIRADPSQAFGGEFRLKRTVDFQRVQRTGRRIHGRHLIVVVLQNGLGHPRFGLAVSRRVGTAVIRNRVKRWLREAVRRERGAVAGYDVVLISRPSAPQAGYRRVYEEVARALATLPAEAV